LYKYTLNTIHTSTIDI